MERNERMVSIMTNTTHIQVEIHTVKNKCLIEDTTVFEFPEEELEIIIEMMRYLKRDRGIVGLGHVEQAANELRGKEI